MCGIFGFISKDGRGPDVTRLKRIAIETQQRGPHAFGLAWIDPNGALHTYKRPGPATANLGDLDACHGAVAMIGHCRWATHGEPEINANNHPHRAGRGWVVHNGVVRNYTWLIRRFGLDPKTECDSEVLGLLIARFPGELGMRAARTTDAADGPLAMMGLWRNPTRLLVVRRDNPLCFGATKSGYYFASLAAELPGKIYAARNSYVGVIVAGNGGLHHNRFTIGC
jgi:glucosamine 6-phosphate synthetase-like amidotransferase/phosphosugar isomerase protein